MTVETPLPRYPAPAKLNLFLHVVGRRTDGYHLLETVFQFLDVGDELSFAVTFGGEIRRTQDVPGVPEASDLTLRAARLLQETTGTTLGAEITLHKHLPSGGGLGGGSSDAATTLIVLNRLWGTELDRAALAGLGLQLGADVPVFVHGHAAWAEGVGEQLTPVDPPEAWVAVLVPPVYVATAEVFRDFARQLTPFSPISRIRGFREGSGRNDLTPLVRARYPLVGQTLDWLQQFGEARMTGSGACVFVVVPDRASGELILARAQAELGFGGFTAQGRNRHPLYEDAV